MLEGVLGDAARVARQALGIRRLRPEQIKTLEAVLNGRDALAILPTGYGKSLIYQVAALMSDRPTLVISPLLALMRDQEASLLDRDLPVVRVDSTVRPKLRRELLTRIADGGPLIILTTPETLESEDMALAIKFGKPRLLCVDEAHCITEWGHDFRPAYLRLGAQRTPLGVDQVLALTATATPRVRDDIIRRLRLDDPCTVIGSPHRANLTLTAHTVPGQDKIMRAGRLLRRMPRPCIVYCATKQSVDDIYAAMRRARIPCSRYHGGMRKAEREEEMALFMKRGRKSIMVATSAFGMGVDKADIRSIMHYQVPGSPEQYVQEAGRAGRDGKLSRCILLFDPADINIQRFLQEKSRPNPTQLRRVAKALEAWAADGRAVGTKDLALSAGAPQTVTASLCAQLEDGGMLRHDDDKCWEVLVTGDKLREGTKDLAGRFEIERRQDEHRLAAMVEYVEAETCRSIFLRRWFGEEDPPPCGNCDRCRAEAGGIIRPQRGKRRRGGAARGGRKRARAGKGSEESRKTGGPGVEGEPKRPRRRRSRRRRRSSGSGSGDEGT